MTTSIPLHGNGRIIAHRPLFDKLGRSVVEREPVHLRLAFRHVKHEVNRVFSGHATLERNRHFPAFSFQLTETLAIPSQYFYGQTLDMVQGNDFVSQQ